MYFFSYRWARPLKVQEENVYEKFINSYIRGDVGL